MCTSMSWFYNKRNGESHNMVRDSTQPVRKHRNGKVVILTKFSSLMALDFVIVTNSGAASDENVVKMTIFPF